MTESNKLGVDVLSINELACFAVERIADFEFVLVAKKFFCLNKITQVWL